MEERGAGRKKNWQNLKLGTLTQYLECQVIVERQNLSFLCGLVSDIWGIIVVLEVVQYKRANLVLRYAYHFYHWFLLPSLKEYGYWKFKIRSFCRSPISSFWQLCIVPCSTFPTSLSFSKLKTEVMCVKILN